MQEKERHEENTEYGFATTRKLTILQTKMEDIPDIVKLYRKKTAIERAEVWHNWENVVAGRGKYESIEEQIIKEQWLVFSIRDVSGKMIGILEVDTDDAKEFQIGIWIPNEAKRISYAEHIKESFIDWICLGECPIINKITEVRLLEKMERTPKFVTIAENIEFEDIEEDVEMK